MLPTAPRQTARFTYYAAKPKSRMTLKIFDLVFGNFKVPRMCFHPLGQWMRGTGLQRKNGGQQGFLIHPLFEEQLGEGKFTPRQGPRFVEEKDLHFGQKR